jgi:hypothetical protein
VLVDDDGPPRPLRLLVDCSHAEFTPATVKRAVSGPSPTPA